MDNAPTFHGRFKTWTQACVKDLYPVSITDEDMEAFGHGYNSEQAEKVIEDHVKDLISNSNFHHGPRDEQVTVCCPCTSY
jgi:hypothetical protein